MSDPLDDLARELRMGAGRELREEAAEDEALSELGRRRRLSMVDVARAALHAGDHLVIRAAGMSLAQPLAAVGDDFVTLDDGESTIDVRLEMAVITVVPRPAGGQAGRPAAATFRARLAEHEQDGGHVEVVTGDGLSLRGRITVVAVDHVAMEDPGGERSYVPIGEIAIVLSRRRPRS